MIATCMWRDLKVGTKHFFKIGAQEYFKIGFFKIGAQEYFNPSVVNDVYKYPEW